MALDNVVWYSRLTLEDIANIRPDEVDILINELDDAVMAICLDWGLFQ